MMLKNLLGIGNRTRRSGGGSLMTQPSAATGSTVHLSDPARQSHANDQDFQIVRRGSFRAVAEPETVDTTDLEADDIVIAVMGPTGSGKSTFVCAASGRDTKAVGHRLKSFTDQVSAVKFWDEETRQYVVLVDTPGFDDTFKSDLDILSMISEWLVSSYNKKKLLSGILYLHRITDNRVAGSSLKNLRVFRKLCGKDVLDKVYLTTTMWDEVETSVGERRLEELKSQYWKVMISQGAQVARCRSDDDSPKDLVRKIVYESHHKADAYEVTQPPPLPENRRKPPSPPSSDMPEEPPKTAVTATTSVASPLRGTSEQGSSSGQVGPLKNIPPVTTQAVSHLPSNSELGSSAEQARPPIHVAASSTQAPGSEQGTSSLKNDTVLGGLAASKHLIGGGQESSLRSQDAGYRTHTDQEPAWANRQATEEPETANTREVDNVLASLGLKERKGLLIQREIADLKKELKETAAGQQLYSQLETLVEKQLQLLHRIEKEKKVADDPEILQELQTEYNDLRAQIDDKLRQMQQLKLSLWKRLRSWRWE